MSKEKFEGFTWDEPDGRDLQLRNMLEQLEKEGDKKDPRVLKEIERLKKEIEEFEKENN